MDYNKIKKGDFVYLFYHEIMRLGGDSNVHSIITLKNSNEKFYVFHKYNEQPHPTVAFEENPIVLAIWMAYAYFIMEIVFPVFTKGYIGYYIISILSLIVAYFLGRFPRLWFGVKKVDVSTLRKISTEEIKEKHMRKLWKSIYFPIGLLIVLTTFFIYVCVFFSQTIDQFIIALTIPIFYIGYLDIINRLISMIKIEKEYNDL